MVKATRKPLEEIFGMVKGFERVLVVGCGGCTSVCLAGGQREVLALADELAECARNARVPQQYACFVTERQCNREFLEDIEERVENCDCLLSLACGAGAGQPSGACAQAGPAASSPNARAAITLKYFRVICMSGSDVK